MASCLIFGGSGYICTKLAEYLLENGKMDTVFIADLRESPLKTKSGVVALKIDVRIPIPPTMIDQGVDWIFNLAAVHREPGHDAKEYYETNILGATHVCEYADAIRCNQIFFTSSISLYGPTLNPSAENTLTTPNTP